MSYAVLQLQRLCKRGLSDFRRMACSPVLGVEQSDGAPFTRKPLQQASAVAAPARGLAHEGRGQLLVVADEHEALHLLASLYAQCRLLSSWLSAGLGITQWCLTG